MGPQFGTSLISDEGPVAYPRARGTGVRGNTTFDTVEADTEVESRSGADRPSILDEEAQIIHPNIRCKGCIPQKCFIRNTTDGPEMRIPDA